MIKDFTIRLLVMDTLLIDDKNDSLESINSLQKFNALDFNLSEAVFLVGKNRQNMCMSTMCNENSFLKSDVSNLSSRYATSCSGEHYSLHFHDRTYGLHKAMTHAP